MAKSKNRWDVIYETVDEKNKKLIPHFAAQNVDWKTALMVKRNNKFIAMEIRPTLRALDAAPARRLNRTNHKGAAQVTQCR